ncbi:DUF1254 domain-containing protein [Humibacter ginsenosidimutans]|uniref:DUF1254 domain-containing protein n=1 Tax=Humibacter ginsenosidimutans TaxID=2599293 RepID=A0A5B8M8L3_9MICO|nr:DUF1254 domain-containing protein [Humibacter ginsenosidimutans]QDZ16394.1 DUF1254 domain-containing protein [Humibacter ginsenosidimutans]
MSVAVTLDNFPRVETDTMIAGMLPIIGAVGVFHHDRDLAPLDRQPVIRQNRDTLYSVAVADLTNGATLTVPDMRDRYISVMVINQDHYINRVYHRPGRYRLTVDEFGTDYAVVAARILFDPSSRADLDEVHALQDGLRIEADGRRSFTRPDNDPDSYKAVRDALLVLGKTMGSLSRCFGPIEDVDPVHHLVATASAWGGLPDEEAQYINVNPQLSSGRYTMRFGDAPADAFWSLSVYDGDGYFDRSAVGATNVNSVFAIPDADGAVTVHLGDWDAGTPNRLALPEGWNLLIRLYRPRLDELKDWHTPEIVPA